MPIEVNLDNDHEFVIRRKPKPPVPPDPLPPLVLLSLIGFSIAVLVGR